MPTTMSQQLVQLANQLINNSNPKDRLKFTFSLADQLGTLLMCPPTILEQLLTKLETEWKQIEDSTPEEIGLDGESLDPLRDYGRTSYHRSVGTVRAFLKIRNDLLNAMESEGVPQEVVARARDGQW